MKTVILSSGGFADYVPQELARWVGKQPDEIGYGVHLGEILANRLVYRDISDVELFKICANKFFAPIEIGEPGLKMIVE